MTNWVDQADVAMRLWAADLGWSLEAFLRLGLAALGGGLVGMEREMRGRQAGFRTNLLVCMGSALVMIVSISFAQPGRWHAASEFTIRLDPARIAYGVMGGIGFLGAGTIIQSRGNIRGLTTAAGLWCVAAIGLSVGFGLYMISAMATVLVLAALWLLDYLDAIVPRRAYRMLTLRRTWTNDCAADTRAQLQRIGWRVGTLSFTRTGDLTQVEIVVRVSARRSAELPPLLEEVESAHSLTLLSVQEG